MTETINLADYMTVAQIAAETGQTEPTVRSWLTYHRHMSFRKVLDNVLVRRTEFAKFQAARPDLCKNVELAGQCDARR